MGEKLRALWHLTLYGLVICPILSIEHNITGWLLLRWARRRGKPAYDVAEHFWRVEANGLKRDLEALEELRDFCKERECA